MSFAVHGPYVALCNNERVIMHDVESGDVCAVLLPDLEQSRDGKVANVHHNNEDIEAYHMITSATFSEDGRYFAVCTNRKQLCLYETKGCRLLSNRTLARAASRVRFAPNNDIVVADKAGDAYLYPTGRPTENGAWILGHLSMLLDVLVTRDTRYILTADREEKIRVSMFPNCYNIAAYCLGHARFVTNITELPHRGNVLLSCGGDGVLGLWDYRHGAQLMCVNLRDRMSECDIERLARDLRDNNCPESVDILPVKHLRASRLGEAESLVVMSFYSNETLLAYSVVTTPGSGEGPQLEANYLESVAVGAEPVECLLRERDLWVLTDAGLRVYKFEDNRFVVHGALSRTVERLNESWETLKSTVVKQSLLPTLYKRKYDGLQEYIARKKLRLESKSR